MSKARAPRSKLRWTEKERAFLVWNWGTKAAKFTAAKLGRSENACYSMLRRLGVSPSVTRGSMSLRELSAAVGAKRGIVKQALRALYNKPNFDWVKGSSLRIEDSDLVVSEVKAWLENNYTRYPTYKFKSIDIISRETGYTFRQVKRALSHVDPGVNKGVKGSPVKISTDLEQRLLLWLRDEPAYRHPRHLNSERWSNTVSSCIRCGTTEKRHRGKGLCSTCYAADFWVKKYSLQARKKSGTMAE